MSLTKVTYAMIDSAPVSVKDYGAVGDGVTDDTAAIQAAINGCITNLQKRLVFPDGQYRTTSTITIPPYYASGMPVDYWGALGQDFAIDFGKAIILADLSAGGVAFEITSGPYPNVRYNLNIAGGSFTSNAELASFFKISGGTMWNVYLTGMAQYNGNPDAFINVSSDSAAANYGLLNFKDMYVRAKVFCAFTSTSGSIKQTDNATIENIYFYGTADTSSLVNVANFYQLSDSRIAQCIQVGKGVFVRGGESGGNLSNCTLTGLYSETTTVFTNLINSALKNCSVSNCRLYIASSLTQTIRWFDAVSVRSTFNNVVVSAGNFSGEAPYDTGAYATLNFATGSSNNAVLGYNPTQYKNAVKGSGNAVSTAPGVTTKDALTTRDTWNAVTTASYFQVGSTIAEASYIGDQGVIDVYVEGCTYGSNPKTFSVNVTVGSSVLTLGGSITQTSGTWSASGRILLISASSTTYRVYLFHGSAVNGATLATNRLGNPDQAAIVEPTTASVQVGVNVASITDGAVVVATASVSSIKRGTFDTAA